MNQTILLLPEISASNPLAISADIDFSHEKNMTNVKRRAEFLSDSMSDFQNLSIDEEAKKIKIAYYQYEGVDKNLVEIRTCIWLNIGRMLIIHRKKVESADIQWTVWAPEKFPFLKQRRREMVMELANFGPKVEPFLYMGVDRLYDFIHKLLQYHDDPDFHLISKRFGVFLKTAPETDEERAEKNIIADKIIEFFKFKRQTNNVNVDKDRLMDVIDSGVTFNKSDYEQITNLAATNAAAADDYLREAHANGSAPTTSTSTHARESLHNILAKLIQTIEEFEKINSFPQIPKVIFKEATHKMQILAMHI